MSDLFLGGTEAAGGGRQYFVRQLWDVKGQGDVLAMDARRSLHPPLLSIRRHFANRNPPTPELLSALLRGGGHRPFKTIWATVRSIQAAHKE